MAYKARLTEKTLVLKAPAAGVHVLWRAPVACKVRAVRAYRLGGTGAVVNAQRTVINPEKPPSENTSDLCSADLSVTTASTWVAGTLASAAMLRFVAGDTLSAEVVSVAGAPTDLTIQVDIEQDANT